MNATNMNATIEYPYYNRDNVFNNDQTLSIIRILILITCSIGLPLNGIVIWVLGFQIKRNPFTILILNLAVSDFGVLIFMSIDLFPYFHNFMPSRDLRFALFYFSEIMYINGLFLLTAISIDRCVAVLFPIWHRCSRPKHLSPAVCGLIWTISFLLGGIHGIMEYAFLYSTIQGFHFLVTAVVCLPLIIASTAILFINITLRPKQIKRGRILVMILITLLCFLIVSVPLYISIYILNYLKMSTIWTSLGLPFYFSLSACLNSSVNPVIYYLVGRKRRARSRESIKVTFQRVFREDEAPETG